jgi:hypothetical protein
MSELWPVIRFKFASALQAWHPSDQSAHVILAPWHKVGWGAAAAPSSAVLCCAPIIRRYLPGVAIANMSALLLQLPLPLPLLASPPTALLLTLIPLPPPLQVFDRKDWEQLLGRSIVPKLAFALQQELAINPLHQELEPFNWVLTWQDVMPLNQASPAGWVGWLAGWAGRLGGWGVHSMQCTVPGCLLTCAVVAAVLPALPPCAQRLSLP